MKKYETEATNVTPEEISKTIQDETLDENWLRDFYSEVGREVTLARESQRETHNWVIAVVGGMITAAWALSSADSFYPTEKSLLLVIVMVPLIFRFFVRSCLEYQIFNRWCSLRNALDYFYYTKSINKQLNQLAMKSLIEQVRLFYFQWKQPKSLGKMLLDNLRLAYAWPFVLVIGLLVWGFFVQELTKLICIVLGITSAFMVYELISFFSCFTFKAAELQYKIADKLS